MIAELFRAVPEARTPYGSHLPVLGRALDLVPHGPVLELGLGDASTPLLHTACEKQNRTLYSYDHDADWTTKFAHLRAQGHVLEALTDYDLAPIEALLWAVALVDHAPASRRITDIQRLQDRCLLIVCHDAEPKHAKAYQYEETLRRFHYRWDDQPLGLPWTTVVSNYLDVAAWWAFD